jgi:hypothetical protein
VHLAGERLTVAVGAVAIGWSKADRQQILGSLTSRSAVRETLERPPTTGFFDPAPDVAAWERQLHASEEFQSCQRKVDFSNPPSTS